jgi:hypothetical protein
MTMQASNLFSSTLDTVPMSGAEYVSEESITRDCHLDHHSMCEKRLVHRKVLKTRTGQRRSGVKTSRKAGSF